MKCHIKDDGYTTLKQWKKKGFVIQDDVKPTVLWNNRYCTYVTEFCRANEVRRMTDDELREYRNEVNSYQKLIYSKKRKEELAERYRNKIYERMTVNSLNINEVDLTVNLENVIVFDVETTGLSFENDEILQLSICNGSGKILMNQYFKPERCISWSDAERINGISPEMVRDMPYIKDFIVDIQKIVDDAELLITYNGVFDRTFLSAFGIEFHGKPEVDVMLEFAEIYGEWSDYYMGNKWQKLTTAATYYGFSYDGVNAHDSSVDVLATLFVLEEMIKEIKPKILAR